MSLELYPDPLLPPALRLGGQPAASGQLEAIHVALNSADAQKSARLLLTLGNLHLQRGEDALAGRWFDEGLAVTRSHRLARSLRSPMLVAVSTAARVQGEFSRAEAHAAAALRSAESPPARQGALLAQAMARRVAGDTWGSLMPTHAAQEGSDRLDARVARTLAWLTLAPADTVDAAGMLAGQVRGTLRARLAWPLAEQALQSGHGQEAGRWLDVAAALPFAREEARLCPLAAMRQGVRLESAPAARTVRVLTLERQGLQVGARFIPVPGDGRLLGLLAFLIHGGPTHWERAADAVLGSGARSALYAQIRHHLSTARHLLGDPGIVTSRRGIITLDLSVAWSCDALDPGTGVAGARPWLPLLGGWWIEDVRAQLAARS